MQTQTGLVHCREIIDRSRLQTWASRIDAHYRLIETARRREGLAAVQRLIPPGQRFVATASSVTTGTVVSEMELRSLGAELLASTAGAWIRGELGARIACDADQAWIRRQYAPAHAPPFHAPHGWHQDGALGFDFLAHGDGVFPARALLRMVTCWIPLGACGRVAPGLELVTRRLADLVAPAGLSEANVRDRFAAAEFWCPELEAGDALLFCGDILHRTHLAPTMTRDRTSVELRFFPADDLPERLAHDRFVAFD